MHTRLPPAGTGGEHLAKELEEATLDVVRRRREMGIDLPNGAWWSYIFGRLGGLGLISDMTEIPIAEPSSTIRDRRGVRPRLRDDYRAFTKLRVDALNHALRGIPRELVRFHCCWGSWHGPHSTDLELEKVIDLLVQVEAGSFSFEAAIARHEHEWCAWQTVDIADDVVLVPGVVGHATNVIEHPRLVADRIERFARIVGPDRVIAATDCGLGGRVHPQIAWAKLDALAQGAELASRQPVA
jgi:methionine synthase II (cobalamin-independent)